LIILVSFYYFHTDQRVAKFDRKVATETENIK